MKDRYAHIIPESTKVKVVSREASLCLLCRGGRRLCGKSVCPIDLKARAFVKNLNVVDKKEFVGSSPPSVFVGRFGYPKVFVGPMVPPMLGNTEIMDLPERWMGESVEDIVSYRYSLIRGKVLVPIESARTGGRLIETLQELAMGASAADTEVQFLKVPFGSIIIDDNSQPFGPSAPMKHFEVASLKVDHRIEKAYYDGDLRAGDAVMDLYTNGAPVSKIQRAFSMGIFGTLKNRRLVPTRWSITAVDSVISQRLIEEIKDYETVDKYLVFVHAYMHNNFAAIFIPRKWSFEWMEAWFPGTFWNPSSSLPSVIGDYESYWGRTTYPDIGGCYFATRLAVTEFLRGIRRQATVLVIREILPEFPLPLGVWFVRENVRSMLRSKPAVFEDLRSALKYIKKFMRVPIVKWAERSFILKDSLLQRRIDDYVRRVDLL
ncbi:MAG: Nre family DNA repair protein [Candidatus Methanomethylicaceae archaeon]|nr:Nre family DNA repair protein [Candidatus Verstraetearchaeota archaeon]